MKYFKPTPTLFFMTALLFFVFAAISPPLYNYLVLDAHLRGLPLPFAFVKGGCTIGLTDCTDFFWASFVFDLLFWYVVAGFLTFLNESIRKG